MEPACNLGECDNGDEGAKASLHDDDRVGTSELPAQSVVDLAKARLSASEAISLLSVCDSGLTDKFAPYNLQALDGHHWQDNGSLRCGDTIDLFAIVYNETRQQAASRVLSLIEEPSVSALIDDIHDQPDAITEVIAQFPSKCLPPVLANMTAEIAKLEHVRDDLPATCLLTAVSGSIGRQIEMPSKPGKTVTGNIYVIIEAESADGKSSVEEHTAAPIREFEDRQLAKFYEGVPAVKARLAIVEHEIKALTKSKPELSRDEKLSLLTKAEDEKANLLKQSTPPCYVTGNATSQALAELMSHNGGMMMSRASDARGVIAILTGRHENDKNRTDDEFYLAAYTVRESYRVHRISRPDVVIHLPCLSLLWLIQDDMYAQLWQRNSLVFGGFLARCLTCSVASTPRKLDRGARQFSESIQKVYRDLLFELLETYRLHSGAPFVVQISDDAQRMLFDYADRIIERRLAGEFTPVEERFVKRWAENAWRMALVLHAATFGARAHREIVSAETARGAIWIVSWFSVQQLAILRERDEKQQGTKEDAVMALVRRHGRVNIRSVKKAQICDSEDEAETILRKLESEGLLEGNDYHGRGPSTRYYMLPSFRRK